MVDVIVIRLKICIDLAFVDFWLPNLIWTDVEVALVEEIRQALLIFRLFFFIHVLERVARPGWLWLSNRSFDDLALLLLVDWLFHPVLGHLGLWLRRT